jgi:hypothetical protein
MWFSAVLVYQRVSLLVSVCPCLPGISVVVVCGLWFAVPRRTGPTLSKTMNYWKESRHEATKCKTVSKKRGFLNSGTLFFLTIGHSFCMYNYSKLLTFATQKYPGSNKPPWPSYVSRPMDVFPCAQLCINQAGGAQKPSINRMIFQYLYLMYTCI